MGGDEASEGQGGESEKFWRGKRRKARGETISLSCPTGNACRLSRDVCRHVHSHIGLLKGWKGEEEAVPAYALDVLAVRRGS